MTDINLNHESQKQIDRLVDGELSDRERRQLIESFEQNPDGWRQCACAFLEAQEFGAALNGMVRPGPQNIAIAPTADSSSTENASRASRDSERGYDRASNLRWWTALAACLAIGVAIGQMNSRGIDSAAPEMPPIAASDFDGSSLDDASAMGTNQMIAADTPTNRSLMRPHMDQQYSVVPNDIEDILGRLGQRVERRQIYMPASTTDPAALPVEEIEIVPVRWDTY